MTDGAESSLSAVRRVTWLGLGANLLLSALKFAAGFFGHSRVMIADAVHSLSDLATDTAVLIGSRYWQRPADKDHPNGHGKIEALVALLIALALLLVSLGLIRDAVISLYGIAEGNVIPAPKEIALVVAIVSIVVKEHLYRVTLKAAHRAKSSALAANAAHHRSDALSSIPAALSVGTALAFGPKWTFLDPVGTIVVAILILFSVREILRDPLHTLIDQGETEEILDRIERISQEIPDIKKIHDIRTRPLGSGHFAADLSIHVDPNMPVLKAHALSHRLTATIKGRIHGIVDVVVHIEPEKQV